MSIIYKLPRCMVEDVYYMVLNHDCVTRNMSIGDPASGSPSSTGGSPDIVPIHKEYGRYVSLQEFVNMIQDGIPYDWGVDDPYEP